MAATAAAQDRFVRRTTLNPDEYRTNFRQIDCGVIEVLTSQEADQVTSQMSKIYLRLTNASKDYWEREGVLRFAGEEREGKWLTAWEQLISLSGVASATARKALGWMSKQGIIGYFAGKNGVGIRIFINRAASSIRQRPGQSQKNLRLVQASIDNSRTSTNEAAFKESFADKEIPEIDSIPHASKSNATDINTSRKLAGSNNLLCDTQVITLQVPTFDSEAVIERIVGKVLPRVMSETKRSQEQTREWFIKDALPKAVRIGQRSAYDILRAHGAINKPIAAGNSCRNRSSDREVGKHTKSETAQRRLGDEEIKELAESCVALMATQGQPIHQIISEMSIEAGGFLLPEDASKVRSLAESLMLGQKVVQGSRRNN